MIVYEVCGYFDHMDKNDTTSYGLYLTEQKARNIIKDLLETYFENHYLSEKEKQDVIENFYWIQPREVIQ